MRTIDLAFIGDLVLDEPDPDHWLSGIAPALRQCDFAIAHLEVPHTNRGVELRGDVPAPGANPMHLHAIPRAGIRCVSLAGNHITDCGAAGIEDTLDTLQALGVSTNGAALSLTAARKPAWVEVKGARVALLSYNCVGPENSWAAEARAGCAYIRVETADGAPISPAARLEHIDDQSLLVAQDDIQRARDDADIVIVALHKGIVHTRARLAAYERPLSHAMVDAGADIVLGHHAHIVRGIEIYRDKPIFHGLGNGCVVTRALSPDQSHPARAEWARKRREMFGFEPDPAYSLAPFHPEAVNAMIGRVRIDNGAMRVGFLPVYVEPPGRPVLADEHRAEAIARYVAAVTTEAGLPTLRYQLNSTGVWLN